MNPESFSFLYERERKKVEKILVEAFKDRKPDSLYKPVKYILSTGGKRLRPLLVIFSTKAVGGNFSVVYNASVAVELLHNFTLVHDDIMDNADKRRGMLTLHKKYDDSTAILAGDGLLSVAYEYLLKDCNGKTKEVISAFTKGLIEVCEGQSLDKDFETTDNVTIDKYKLMIMKKTAAMFEMCCTVGALLGGGSPKEIKAVSLFGKNIGIAFQIQDDLLDISGDEKKFGKKVGGDLIEGKKTFLFIKALSKAKGNDKKKLIKVIKNNGIKPQKVNMYKHLYEKLGVIENAKAEIKFYTNRALRSLKALKKEDDKEIFSWLANSLIKRIK
ncbi:MAG: geranylgeranyl pyrophosphate synthase [Ignavibacteria bacterium GWA2_35_9]|nr:MAG: geranylgeranyl pyrophosphate synthase [Ignavibacteria bacterium GWA2_35_9]OGU47786.1 MAG: geranylgeranyl pyrophosphate synthase [Ignavibacteria bacterium GWB2_36_8]